MKTSNQETSDAHVYRVTLQDYWVDFLGGLLPGALFVVVMVLMFFPTLLIVSGAISDPVYLDFGGVLGDVVKVTTDTQSMM